MPTAGRMAVPAGLTAADPRRQAGLMSRRGAGRARRSEKIVERHRLVEIPHALAHRRNTAPLRRLADPLRLDERAEDGEREICMPGFDGLIEPIRQLALARQRAMPFAIVIGEAANLPERQFKIDQRQRCIGPRSGSDQLLDARRLLALTDLRISPAHRAGHLGHQSRIDFAGAAEPLREPTELMKFPDMEHGFRLFRARGRSAGRLRKMVKTPFESERRRTFEI